MVDNLIGQPKPMPSVDTTKLSKRPDDTPKMGRLYTSLGAPIKSARSSRTANHPYNIDLYEQLASPSLSRPKWFMAGLLVGFVVCCLGGRIAAGRNPYENFHRFHRYINPTSSFYPTVSQMVSLVEEQSKPNQTIVIVGGNSIFYGFGQNGLDLWTLSLQNLLGKNFAVFNFAMPSSEPFEGAYCSVEALLKKRRKVIYATVAAPATTGFAEGSDVYGYAYWDAHEKRMLFHDTVRDSVVAKRLEGHNPQKRWKLNDTILRKKLDALFYFEDLWTTIGYSSLFTVWTEPASANPFTARKRLAEEQYELVPISQRVKIEFVKALKPNYQNCFVPNSRQLKNPFWSTMQENANSLIPTTLKRNCIVVVSTPMPRYLAMLSPLDRVRENTACSASQRIWSNAGFHSLSYAGQLEDADYSDGVHLSATGGKKLAELLALNVHSVAKELGY